MPPFYDQQGQPRLTQIHDFARWDSHSPTPTLARGALHLWHIHTGPIGADPDRLWPLLCTDEQQRARRFATETHRGRFVRAHGGLRFILGLYLKQKPQHIVFGKSSTGKPGLTRDHLWQDTRLEFNLTGSHDLALVAVSSGYPVGVDCEHIAPRRETMAVARRMFPADVVRALEAAPEDERLDGFFAAWTALEAEVKADGRGLFHPPDPLAPALDIAQFAPQPGYIAAVARQHLPPADAWESFAWSLPD